MSQWYCDHGVLHSVHDRKSPCPECRARDERVINSVIQAAWSLPDIVQRIGIDKKYRRLAWGGQVSYAWFHALDDKIYRHSPLYAFGELSATDILASDWVEWDSPAPLVSAYQGVEE